MHDAQLIAQVKFLLRDFGIIFGAENLGHLPSSQVNVMPYMSAVSLV